MSQRQILLCLWCWFTAGLDSGWMPWASCNWNHFWMVILSTRALWWSQRWATCSAPILASSGIYLCPDLHMYHGLNHLPILKYSQIIYILKQFEPGSEKAKTNHLSYEFCREFHQGCIAFVQGWRMCPHRVNNFKWIAMHYGHLAWWVSFLFTNLSTVANHCIVKN